MCLNKIINNKATLISQKVAQKNSAKIAKVKVVIPQQMLQSRNNVMSLKGKRKKNITNMNKITIGGQLEPQSLPVTLY